MSNEYSFAWDFPADCYRVRLRKDIHIQNENHIFPAFTMLDVSSIECLDKEGNYHYEMFRRLKVELQQSNSTLGKYCDIIQFDVKDYSQIPLRQSNAMGFHTDYKITRQYDSGFTNKEVVKGSGNTIIDIIFLGRRKQYIEVTDFFEALEKIVQQYKNT